ncbi:hypothetical protein [Treponema sp.]|uniref:hypothetical protein n=1 Tax=Treponema sp. TaxID=166 RepID=UPI003F026A5A
MKKKLLIIAGFCLLGSAVFAENALFGWQKGLSENSVRHKVFEKVSSFATDSERESYMQANGIGGDGPYHNAEHLDTPGYDSKEMKALQESFKKADLSKMSDEQRAEFYKKLKK